MLFACFCWHVEDLYMYAVNYLHMGAAKTWYTIPSQYKEKFEEIYKAKFPNIFAEKPDVLHHLNLMMCPVEAARNYVPIYRTDQ